MNKKPLIRKRFLISFIIFGVILGCSKDKDPTSYLEEVLNSLEQINSATYYAKSEGFAPGDTSAFITAYSYVMEYSNPADTLVGASFLNLKQEDTTILDYCYNGKMKANVYHNEKGILIDSFKNDPRPFRIVNTPFFTLTKRLIEYALETEDSITIDSKESGDSIQFCFCIYDTIVEIIGIRIVYPRSRYGSHKGKVSKYNIWINRSDDLPYRFERDMPHDKNTIECRGVKLNVGRLEDFEATEYFPTDYEVREFIRGARTTTKSQLEGQPAPDWVLKDADNNSIALKNLKSKVLLIQFTSVSCGPCRASVPFLNQLESEYDKNVFDFVSIESYNQNPEVLKSYRHRSNLNYKFLISTKEVTKSYQIEVVPTFYILDENRVIRKVIQGYRNGITDTKICETIRSLI